MLICRDFTPVWEWREICLISEKREASKCLKPTEPLPMSSPEILFLPGLFRSSGIIQPLL